VCHKEILRDWWNGSSGRGLPRKREALSSKPVLQKKNFISFIYLCILIIYLLLCFSLFLSADLTFQLLSLFQFQEFLANIVVKVYCRSIISAFAHLNMSLFSLHFYRVFSLDMEIWADFFFHLALESSFAWCLPLFLRKSQLL
jgi:hypothetical protein